MCPIKMLSLYIIRTANETRRGTDTVEQGFQLSQPGSHLEAALLDASENLRYQKAYRKLNLHENQGTS